MLDRMRPHPSAERATTAAAVSSQLVSRPRTRLSPPGLFSMSKRKDQVCVKGSAQALMARNSRQSLAPGGKRLQAAKIRMGTRGSPLALAQAREVRRRLAEAHGFGEDACELVIIKTTGDRITDRP